MSGPLTSTQVVRCAELICSSSTHVSIDDAAIRTTMSGLSLEDIERIASPQAFDEGLHFGDGGPLTVQALLVVDALNFCFWPDPEMQYEHLAGGVKAALQRDPTALSADKLAVITGPGVRALLSWPRDLPQQEERARLLREVGCELAASFGGEAASLVQAAEGSAVRLVALITAHFPGFRDQAIYKGQQVFFYKRAQIFVADVYGAFQGAGMGAFTDVDQLTMFADYRVPVVLRVMGILHYSEVLEAKVLSCAQLPAGGEEECEIRAACIIAVERMKRCLHSLFSTTSGALAGEADGGASDRAASCAGDVAATAASAHSGRQPASGLPKSLQLDWWLWEMGERSRDRHPPHHRTLTTFY